MPTPSSPDRRKLGSVEIERRAENYSPGYLNLASFRLRFDGETDHLSIPMGLALYAAAEQYALLQTENDRSNTILQRLGWDPAEGWEDAEERIEALQALAREVDALLAGSYTSAASWKTRSALDRVRALGALGKEESDG